MKEKAPELIKLVDQIETELTKQGIEHKKEERLHDIKFEVIVGEGKSRLFLRMERKKGSYRKPQSVPTIVMNSRRSDSRFQPRRDGTVNVRGAIKKAFALADDNSQFMISRREDKHRAGLRRGALYALSFLFDKEVAISSRWSIGIEVIMAHGTKIDVNVTDDGYFRFGFRHHGLGPKLNYHDALAIMRSIDQKSIEPKEQG